jgi:hypothetical protein
MGTSGVGAALMIAKYYDTASPAVSEEDVRSGLKKAVSGLINGGISGFRDPRTHCTEIDLTWP